MKRILITGGAGFIGTNFVYYWIDRYPEDKIVVLDELTYAGNIHNLENATVFSNFSFVKGNICDHQLIEKLLNEQSIDTIVHFAAESHVDRSIAGPDDFIQTNIVGTHSLLKAARKIWLDKKETPHRFHHISTDEVYGTLNPEDDPFSETTPYAPNSPYAASKAASDHLVRAYHETYGLQVTTSNCSNNYGPYQFPEKLIPLVIANILDGKSLPVYGDGKQVRDWLYVDDHNRGVDLILHEGKVGETYNIGGNNEKTNIELVTLLCEIIYDIVGSSAELQQKYPQSPAGKGIHPQTLIRFVDDRLGHDRRYAINPAKISRELGFVPKESFETGIKKTILWYLNNEAWWRKVMDGSYKEWIESYYKKKK